MKDEQLPDHKCGLYLSHNEHRDYYETAEAWLGEERQKDLPFPSDADKAAAIAANDVWVLQWYPETPIGFHKIAASSLDGLLEFVAKEPPTP